MPPAQVSKNDFSVLSKSLVYIQDIFFSPKRTIRQSECSYLTVKYLMFYVTGKNLQQIFKRLAFVLTATDVHSVHINDE